jgi:cold shock CspA family protein
MVGTLTFWNNQRGFGFITIPNGDSVFLHITNFKPQDGTSRSPVLGAFLSFEIGPGVRSDKKHQALNARFAALKEIKHAAMGGLKALSVQEVS